MYRELTEAAGVPGQERDVREVMRKYLQPLGQVETDNLGSIVAVKRGTSDRPRIMVVGHMDEIGFMVKYITEDGFIKFQTLGGWSEQVMLAQRVVIKTRKGDVIGVVGSKPPHILDQDERKKVVDKKDMFIDIGAKDRKEAEEFGVRPGDPIVPLTTFTPMKNEKLLLAKAWDNRAGCAVAIQVLEELQGVNHPNTVYAGGTVQEEVGLRGAQTSSALVEPDIGFAVDVGIAGDMPGVKPEQAQAKIGKGPVITLYDASMVPHVGLRDFVIEVAEKENIPYQFDALAGGGTDAGRIHQWSRGVPSLYLGIATRYIHSHVGILHRDDLDNAARLLAAVIRRLDAKTVDAIKNS